MTWLGADNGNNGFNLFSDKRMRENRPRRSIISIDDTDHLMDVRAARRRSIVLLTNAHDDIDVYSSNSWNHLWKNVSPDNIRNMLNKNKEAILQNPVPKLGTGGGAPPGKQQQQDAETVVTADESEPSRRSSSTSTLSSSTTRTPSLSSSSISSGSTIPQQQQQQQSSWRSRLNAISRWEHRQEQEYHDTLDERQKVQQNSNNNTKKAGYRWPGARIQSVRDGLDFSRDVNLARRSESLYAMADSFTDLYANNMDDLHDNDNDNNNDNKYDNEYERNSNGNGYMQDNRKSSSPKTKKCVLDLIS
jgi:hypothetical protein